MGGGVSERIVGARVYEVASARGLLENGAPFMVESSEPVFAFVVLGCRPGEATELTGAALRRVEACAAAVREARGDDARSACVVCSGGRAWDGRVEADAFAEGLVRHGVPRERLVLERVSMTTRENARYTAALLRRRRVARVRLVTCAWHMPRAAAHFRREGLEVDPCPAPFPGGALAKVVRALRERGASWVDEALS